MPRQDSRRPRDRKPNNEDSAPAKVRKLRPDQDRTEQRRKHARQRRDREEKRQRHARTRGRYRGLYSVVSAVLIVIAMAAAALVFFRVDAVQASGVTRYSEEEIVKASGVKLDSNLILLDTDAIEEQVERKLPYLKSATVHRSLPGRVVISVEECTPAAAVSVSNGYWLVDETGKLLELTEDSLNYPVVSGISLLAPAEGSTITVDSAYRLRLSSLLDLLQAMVDQDVLWDASTIDLSDGSELIMRYTEKYKVKIPYASDFDYKVRAMKGIIDELAAEGDQSHGLIDLTLEDEWHFIPE